MASAADRFNINSQLEHLQSRYVGTGHADTNRFEWAVNIHRDSYAAYVGRPTMLQYFAVAENESIGRVRYNMMQVRDRSLALKRASFLRRRLPCRPRARATRPRWWEIATLTKSARAFGASFRRKRRSKKAPASAAESANLTSVPHVFRSTQKMLLPCGVPPEREEE